MSDETKPRESHEGDFTCNSLIGGTDGVCDCMRADRMRLAATITSLREELAAAKVKYDEMKTRADNVYAAKEILVADLAAARRSLNEAQWLLELCAAGLGPCPLQRQAFAFLATPAATPPPCASWCGKRHDTHEHDYGEVFQDMPARVQMTRCYCTAACRDAGAPRNPVKP